MFVWNITSEKGLFLLAGVAVAVSIVIEGMYFRSTLRKENRQLGWSWIVVGNIISSLLLLSIALGVRTLEEQYPHLWRALLPYYGAIQLIAIGICIATAAVALVGPTLRGLAALLNSGPLAVDSSEAKDTSVDNESADEQILMTSASGTTRTQPKSQPVGNAEA